MYQEKANKIKKSNGETVENVDIVVSQDKDKKNSWLTVRLTATKNPIMTGIIVKGKSDVKHINKKEENVMISLLVVENKKQEKQILKIQLETAEAGKKLV